MFQKNALQPELPVVLPLLQVKRETPRRATLFFARGEPVDDPCCPCVDLSAFVPGQFMMVWLPDVDEKPYTISYLADDCFGVTVQRRGRFSSLLHELAVGAPVGFRGPFGRGFMRLDEAKSLSGIALVGGGCGMATLALLHEMLPGSTLVQGSRTACELLYRDRFPYQVIFTDDGSAGARGFPTEWLHPQVERGEVSMVYTCGPELMMADVVKVCNESRTECQASLERYMKCGIGICGQCECDGQRVCVEGPVFTGDELAQMPSFGKAARTKTGKKVPLSEYGECPGAGPPAD